MCEGFSKILQQALKSSKIDCIYIEGTSDSKQPHAWNQVKIDGQWYNCDLTWDSDRIQNQRPLEYCLQNDEEFILHNPESKGIKICNQSYDRNKINSYLGYATAPDYEERKYSSDELINLLKKFGKYSKNGIRASISENFETGDYYLGIGNLIDNDSIIWSENKIMFDSLNEFMQKYELNFPTYGIKKMRNCKFYKE